MFPHDLALRHTGSSSFFLEPAGETLMNTNCDCVTHLPQLSCILAIQSKKSYRIDIPLPRICWKTDRIFVPFKNCFGHSPSEIIVNQPPYCYVYVMCSQSDHHLYVGFTANLPARMKEHNGGTVPSTRRRRPLELVYWEGCLNQTDATARAKYLKSAWGKRYIKRRLRHYLTG